MRELTHRDSVHGDVQYDRLAAALIDTGSLQRLGRVYQLGCAHLVYRGGTHTRLSHAMGAAHVGGRLVDYLRRNYLAPDLPEGAIAADEFLPCRRHGVTDEARWDVLRHLVSWAALLHDVAHVPLGHTLEDEFEGFYHRHDDLASPRMPVLWFQTPSGQPTEIRSVFSRDGLLPASFTLLGVSGHQAWQATMLICLAGNRATATSAATLDERLAMAAASLFITSLREALDECRVSRLFLPYMADLVANTIGADDLDYIRRDPFHVGLDVLRDDRVASRFYVGRDRATGHLHVALALVDRRGKPRTDVCTGVIELVRQRFRFAEIIYYHRTKVAASVMLARAMALVGTPPEVGPERVTIDLDRVDDLVHEVVRHGAEGLRRRSSPTALLDLEIGDESLLLWLQQRTWSALHEAREHDDRDRVADCLRALSLLQGVTGRRLYKVALAIDQTQYGHWCGKDASPSDVEAHIATTLHRFRSQTHERVALEGEMTRAAGFPAESLLLHVPPRKSQAKGVETAALDRSGIVTLGAHPAVRDEVARLGAAYQGLWRLFVFVHPTYASDARGLSRATDVFVEHVWPGAGAARTVPNEVTWFPYGEETRKPGFRNPVS